MNPKKSNWMVLDDNRDRICGYYDTLEMAAEKAEAFAKKDRGLRFLVCKVEGICRSPEVVWVEETPDLTEALKSVHIPF